MLLQCPNALLELRSLSRGKSAIHFRGLADSSPDTNKRSQVVSLYPVNSVHPYPFASFVSSCSNHPPPHGHGNAGVGVR
jgi:hypothetical protein